MFGVPAAAFETTLCVLVYAMVVAYILVGIGQLPTTPKWQRRSRIAAFLIASLGTAHLAAIQYSPNIVDVSDSPIIVISFLGCGACAFNLITRNKQRFDQILLSAMILVMTISLSFGHILLKEILFNREIQDVVESQWRLATSLAPAPASLQRFCDLEKLECAIKNCATEQQDDTLETMIDPPYLTIKGCSVGQELTLKDSNTIPTLIERYRVLYYGWMLCIFAGWFGILMTAWLLHRRILQSSVDPNRALAAD